MLCAKASRMFIKLFSNERPRIDTVARSLTRACLLVTYSPGESDVDILARWELIGEKKVWVHCIKKNIYIGFKNVEQNFGYNGL